MAKEWLTSLGQKGNEEYDAKVRAKLKGSGSLKRKQAQQIRRIKEMTDSDKIEERCMRLVSDETYSAVHIALLIDAMLKKDLKPDLRAKLIDISIKAHTAFHGTKSKNLNVNIDMSSDKIMKRLKEYVIVEDKNGKGS